jgi:hypothetical protein
MSITIKEGDLVGIWYVRGEVAGQQQDWLAGLSFKEVDGERVLVLQYRFRYYTKDATDDPFKDNDRKSWYSVVVKDEPVEKIIVVIHGMLNLLKTRFGTEEHDELLVKNFPSFKAFMNYFSDRPWIWSKFLSKEELVEQEK